MYTISVFQEKLDQLIGCISMLVKVVVTWPDGVVEIEVSKEDGSGEEGGDGLHCLDHQVVSIIVGIENEEGGGGGSDFKAHEVVGGSDVRLLLEGLAGALWWDVNYDIRGEEGEVLEGRTARQSLCLGQSQVSNIGFP